MYHKALKESGSHLSVLVVDEACEYRDLLEKNLSKLFETFIYASDYEEALLAYENVQFDIVLIDIDKEIINGLDLILQIQKVDLYQSIFVYSNHEESALLIKLLNLGIACFMNKSENLENYYKTFSKVSNQICDKKMLMHYVSELEAVHYQDNHESVVIVPEAEDDFEFFPTPSQPEDDFEFFFTSSVQTKAVTEDNSIYKDYYTFLDDDDREDLKDLLGDIDYTFLNAFSEDRGDVSSIINLGNLWMRYGNILIHYQFFSDIGAAILEFGKALTDESEKVATEANSFHPLISGLCSGLQVFMLEVWEKESDNPKYFNDSMINDMRFIVDMIVPPVVVDNDDDLVFF